MRMVLQCGVALLIAFHAPAFSQSPKPLATQYVGCVLNGQGVGIASQRVQTHMFASKTGERAFAVVVAESIGGSRQNTASLYVTERHGSPQLVFRQQSETAPDGSTYDGNGVEAIRWSPSGKRLLAEISQWNYGSDSGVNAKYVLFTHGDHAAIPISPTEAVSKQFKRPCVVGTKSIGWLDDDRIEVEASPIVQEDEEGICDYALSCIQTPMRFSFDVRTGSAQPLGVAK